MRHTHGLICGSVVPPAPIQALRDLTRTREQLVREVTQHTLRIPKVGKTPTSGLQHTFRLLDTSGRAMLDALITGTDP